jgi:prevent-host-death family protein
MKKINLEEATLDGCVRDAQQERVIVTRNGRPAALIVGIEDLDEEQLELAGSAKFWALIAERRKEKTVSRTTLEKELGPNCTATPSGRERAHRG